MIKSRSRKIHTVIPWRLLAAQLRDFSTLLSLTTLSQWLAGWILDQLVAVTLTHLTLESFRWADKVVIQNPSLNHPPSHIQRKSINPAHVLPVCLGGSKTFESPFFSFRMQNLRSIGGTSLAPRASSFKWKPGILVPGLQGKDHFIINQAWQHRSKLHQLQSKAGK